MFNTFTNNPVPTVLIGLGLYWLVKDVAEPSHDTKRRHRSENNQWSNNEEDFQPSMEEQVTEEFQTAKDAVQGQVSEWKDEASHQAQEWKEQAGQQAKEWKVGAGRKWKM